MDEVETWYLIEMSVRGVDLHLWLLFYDHQSKLKWNVEMLTLWLLLIVCLPTVIDMLGL